MKRYNLTDRNLKIDMPELSLEWNYVKNNSVPEDYFKSSRHKVWWVCKNGHEWDAKICTRVMEKTNCPYCANLKACPDNCLETLYPEVSSEWDFNKNELTPQDVLPKSNKKVWWKCINGHEWKAWIADRTNGTRCTQCNYNYIVRERKDIYNEDGTKKYCKCCSILLDISFFRMRGNNEKGYYESNTCNKCEAKLVNDYRITDRGIAAEIVRRTKYISKKKSIPFDLDKEWILDRLNSIDWKCELTGIKFNIIRYNLEHKKTGFQWNSLSIDKIDPSKGYVKSNVRFILNQINVFKQDGTDDRMFMLSELLLNNRKINE